MDRDLCNRWREIGDGNAMVCSIKWLKKSDRSELSVKLVVMTGLFFLCYFFNMVVFYYIWV